MSASAQRRAGGARHWRAVGLCLVALAVMGGLTAASVPLYRLFCAATGYAGTTRRSDHGAKKIVDRVISVRFDANVAPDAPLRFRPLQASLSLKLGEKGLAFYEIENIGARPTTFKASYNVSPGQAGAYFVKLSCFCFSEQTLRPGEALKLPVIFYVDPEMVKDAETKDIGEVVLSYTYFRAAS